MYEHKWKKEKTPPLEICNKVPKELVVVHKKWLTRHVVKQVPKIDRIQEHPTSLELIPWENLQHNGIASHIVYVHI
jgi:hypothetical protein